MSFKNNLFHINKTFSTKTKLLKIKKHWKSGMFCVLASTLNICLNRRQPGSTAASPFHLWGSWPHTDAWLEERGPHGPLVRVPGAP